MTRIVISLTDSVRCDPKIAYLGLNYSLEQRMISWCKENLKPGTWNYYDSWCKRPNNITFANGEDALAFEIRFMI